ncbi:peptidase inhibitor family I36 protein [Streptomyces sp. NPDC093252]|uniref:peptidase inhibitor family I36 protein n=1 Tax=Streptomyces sp. NPDC093252 TaxID=3154980 RepID=UPI003442FD91
MIATLRKAKRTAALFVGATALAATAGLVTATPAAAGDPNVCNGYQLCLWYDGNYENTRVMWDYLPIDGNFTVAHDVTSSLVNNSSSTLCFYEHPDYGGLEFRVAPWARWAYVPSWINDKISSMRRC